MLFCQAIDTLWVQDLKVAHLQWVTKDRSAVNILTNERTFKDHLGYQISLTTEIPDISVVGVV